MSGKAGASGRPPTPLEVKRKRGTDRPDRTPRRNETIAILPAAGAEVPLALGPAGRQMWVELTEAPWVAMLDVHLVETFCQLADDQVEMAGVIAQEGLELAEPITTPAGVVVGTRKVAHPLLKELRNLQKHKLELATALGFTPVSRSRLGVAEIKARSKLAALKARIENPAD